MKRKTYGLLSSQNWEDVHIDTKFNHDDRHARLNAGTSEVLKFLSLPFHVHGMSQSQFSAGWVDFIYDKTWLLLWCTTFHSNMFKWLQQLSIMYY